MSYRPLPILCGRGCGRPRRHGGRLCAQCHAASMREYRREHWVALGELKAEIDQLRNENVRLRQEQSEVFQCVPKETLSS